MNKINIIYMLCVFITILFILYIFTYTTVYFNEGFNKASEYVENDESIHKVVVDNFIRERQNWNLSNLGINLYINQSFIGMKSKIFKILVWKNGKFLERRHLKYFQNIIHNPFEGCSVNNCNLTYDENELNIADAVLFLLHRTQSVNSLPESNVRSKNQRWIFLTDESPHHTFLYSKNNKWTDYRKVFNWSMSYRSESDIPVPYGRTVPLKIGFDRTVDLNELIPNFHSKRRDVLAAIMISNCGRNNGRLKYLKELEKYMKVDIYGKCGKELKGICAGPNYYGINCPNLDQYMFYLAFENSNCKDYMTEKLFWNSYSKGSVPIIMGASRENCRTLLPPHSYIHTDDYADPKDLAKYLLDLNETLDSWKEYHDWRYHFEVTNEHGYYGTKSYHYCRICEALNYNSVESKVYNDLSSFLNITDNCEIID